MARQIIPSFGLGFTASATGLGLFTAGSFDGALFDQCQAVMPCDGTFTKLRFELETAPGAGTSWTLALIVNGTPTGLSVVLSDSDTLGIAEALVAVSAGDLVRYQLTESGSPTNATFTSAIEFEPSTPGQYVYGFRERAGWNSTAYAAPFYGEAFDSSSSLLASIMPDGTVTRWDINMADGVFPYDATPGAHTLTYTLRLNGVDQDGTGGTPDTVMTFTGSTNILSKTFSLPVSEGDLLQVKCVVSGTPGVRPPAGTILFEGDVQAFTRCGVDSGLSNYQWIIGSGTGGQGSPYHDWASESDREWIASSPFTLSGLLVDLPAISSGQTFTVTLRKNGADTALTATVSYPTTSASMSGSVIVVEGDTLDLHGVVTGTGVINPRIVLVGESAVDAKLGCFVAGAHATPRATLVAAFGLDGDAHVEDDPKTFVVWADKIKLNAASVEINGSPAADSLDDLSDVVLTSPAAGEVLTYDGADWVNATPTGGSGGIGDGGALVFLEEHIASSSASLDFTTAISSAYDEYVIELINLIPATDAVNLLLRMSTDGGATYDSGNNYQWAGFRASKAGSAAAGATATSSIGIDASGTQSNTTARGGVSGVLRLFSPGSTTVYKRVRVETSIDDGSSNPDVVVMVNGAYTVSGTAVNAFRFLFSSGNIASGTGRVFGIRNTNSGATRTAEVSLSSADILALRATPKELVAAPGAGFLNEFVAAVLLLDATATAYVESSANLAVKYTDGSGAKVSEDIEATGFIDQTADTMTRARPKLDPIIAKSGSENKALVLHNLGAGEYTTGTGTMRVKVTYRTWSTGW